MRELDKLEFDGCEFPDGHTWWVVLDDAGEAVGYASAVYRSELGYVYLSRCMVMECARGNGLQKRLLRARVKWARSLGAQEVITYTLLKNYESLTNLLRFGFRFYEPTNAYLGPNVHYYRYALK